MTDTFIAVLPSAGRLMMSLRDIGYDFPSAVADLVDNSIDANSRRVDVDLTADGANSWLRISDDGIGMTGRTLDEAMRYGSHARYRDGALGQFGLGLKTASLSQCRRLTVASRGSERGRIAARRWDIDEVVHRDSWHLEKLRSADLDDRLTERLPAGRTGTVVLWENLDRVLPRRPTTGMTARVLGTATVELREHLAMVFHRFLDGEAYRGRHTLMITLNGTPLEAWDPFARSEPLTRVLPAQVMEFEDPDGRRVAVDVQPYVLPGQHLFSSPETHRAAGGPKRWNRQQGFYIYRRERMIQAGGWNRLRTLDEHAKLARIALDLPIGEEERFAVDVAKMRVTLPEDLRSSLRALAAAVVAAAQDRYRDHLDATVPIDDVGTRTPRVEAISLSRDWPAILAVVDEVLGDDPALRDRLLVRLVGLSASRTVSADEKCGMLWWSSLTPTSSWCW
jgi:hypothetical protein